MLKLFGKIFLLTAIVIMVNNVFYHFSKLPFSWGNFYEKEYCLEHNAPNFNTILMGSSRVYRQIDPILFDSLNNGGTSTHTFNFGIDAMTIPEEYYEFEHIIAVPNFHPKYMLVEMCDVDTFAYVNLHTVRKKYYYDFTAFYNSSTTLAASEYSFTRRLTGLSFHFLNFVESLMHFDTWGPVNSFKRKELYSSYACGSLHDALLNSDTASVIFQGERRPNAHMQFLNHTVQLGILTEHTKALFANAGNLPVNRYYLQLVNKMIDEGKKHSVQVIFILPPKLEEIHYRNVLPVFNQLPAANKIELANPTEYPDFYSLNYAYDLGHLDKFGSQEFVAKLSEQFQKVANK